MITEKSIGLFYRFIKNADLLLEHCQWDDNLEPNCLFICRRRISMCDQICYEINNISQFLESRSLLGPIFVQSIMQLINCFKTLSFLTGNMYPFFFLSKLAYFYPRFITNFFGKKSLEKKRSVCE